MRSAPVTTIIPAFNAETYLAEAIESVLAQSVRPRQIVVVDDGSTDATADVAGGFPLVELVRTPHRGLGAALNRGVAAAGEACLAFLDADDLWAVDKLETQLRALEQADAPDMVFGWMSNFYSPDVESLVRGRVDCPPDAPACLAGTMLARRAVIDRVGAFETEWLVGQFIDWYMRAREMGLTQAVLPSVVLKRRLHLHNLTRSPAARLHFARLAKAALDRQRRRS